MGRILMSWLALVIWAAPGVAAANAPLELDWLDLLPAEDRAAMERVPEAMAELNEKLLAQGMDRLTPEVEMPAVLSSTAVRPELDGTRVRLPGFLVPLEVNERGDAVTFFLVPYFGACIHVPPPPPNQMVFVSFPGGIPADAIWDPYWVVGPLRIETTSNDLGIATYAIEAENISLYDG